MVSQNTEWIEVLKIEKQKKTYKEVRIFSVNKNTKLIGALKVFLEGWYAQGQKKGGS